MATLKDRVMEIKIDQLLREGQSDGSTQGGLVYANTLLQGTVNRDDDSASEG